MNVLLLSEKTLKEDSLINDNVDSMYIIPAIQVAQEQALQQLIGSKLYRRICECVEQNTLTADYKLLLDNYVIPYLEYKVMSDIQIPLSYKFRNLGMNQTIDERTMTPSLRDTQYLIEYYDNKAKFYGDRLYDYLSANHKLFPDFRKKDSCDDLVANKMSYKTNIVLD